jgi:hypothetical protein
MRTVKNFREKFRKLYDLEVSGQDVAIDYEHELDTAPALVAASCNVSSEDGSNHGHVNFEHREGVTKVTQCNGNIDSSLVIDLISGVEAECVFIQTNYAAPEGGTS